MFYFGFSSPLLGAKRTTMGEGVGGREREDMPPPRQRAVAGLYNVLLCQRGERRKQYKKERKREVESANAFTVQRKLCFALENFFTIPFMTRSNVRSWKLQENGVSRIKGKLPS